MIPWKQTITKEEYYKAKATIELYIATNPLQDRMKDENVCTKCGTTINRSWEDSANNMTIDINIACTSTNALWGVDSKLNFNHPAIKKGHGQKLVIKIGNQEDYRLCDKCYRKLVKRIGDFLKETENL